MSNGVNELVCLGVHTSIKKGLRYRFKAIDQRFENIEVRSKNISEIFFVNFHSNALPTA